eukprot:jgi/Psemu1/4764/gm1.4764_g
MVDSYKFNPKLYSMRTPDKRMKNQKAASQTQAKMIMVDTLQPCAKPMSILMGQPLQLVNSPVTPHDVQLMRAILGPSISRLKGKTVQHKKQTVEPNVIPISQHIRDHYMETIMGIDIMYINSVPFLTTISRHVHYGTNQTGQSTKTNDILPVIHGIINFYRKQSFQITTILADGQFKPPTMSFLAGKHIELNIVSCDEHDPEAKRYNQTMKEQQCHCIFSTLPYNKVPKRMIVEMVRNGTFYLNAFPWNNGVSNDLPPTTIVTGIAPDYSLHFQVAYGTYAQTWDKTDNTMKARTTGAIAMEPTQNFQGGVDFFSLLSGWIISRTPSDYTICSMPDEAIQCIERLARSSRPGLLHFTSINSNEPYASDNDDDDSTYSPSSDEEYDSDSSHNDDDPINHTTAPAGATNADANDEKEPPLKDPPLGTKITKVVIVEPTTIDGDAEEITGVASVDPPANTDNADETTDEEADKASTDDKKDDVTIKEQHEEDPI